MSERMTYGEVLRLTEGHGTSELWERWQEMTTRLAAAEHHHTVDCWGELTSLRADLAAARRDGLCKDASIVLLQEEVLKARRALEEKERECERLRNGLVDLRARLSGLGSFYHDISALLAPERPRRERGVTTDPAHPERDGTIWPRER